MRRPGALWHPTTVVPADRTTRPASFYLDAAAVGLVLTLVLYGLGWAYWANYYATFGIDTSWFRFGLAQALAPTAFTTAGAVWALTLCGLALALHGAHPDTAPGKTRFSLISFSLCGLVWAAGLVILAIPYYVLWSRQLLAVALVLACGALAGFVLSTILKREILTINWAPRYLSSCALLLALALGVLCYSIRGWRDAYVVMAYRPADTQLLVRDQADQQIRGTFVGYMAGKYFLFGSGPPATVSGLAIIEATAVSSAFLEARLPAAPFTPPADVGLSRQSPKTSR